MDPSGFVVLADYVPHIVQGYRLKVYDAYPFPAGVAT